MNERKNIQERTKKAWSIADVRHSSLLAINFAFQNTINWGGLTWKLNEADLKEIRDLIDPNDNKKNGSQLWKWFYGRWGREFYTVQKMEHIGIEFMRNLSRYYV
ncbi:MAG: hypothetical protein U9R54_07025 [Bacteroidota bacterium]|nr:hypothetical protein [Bacteroidota bacterium]